MPKVHDLMACLSCEKYSGGGCDITPSGVDGLKVALSFDLAHIWHFCAVNNHLYLFLININAHKIIRCSFGIYRSKSFI